MKKQITLQQISLTYFKGVKNKTINFDGNTNIFGKNGTGKSTVFDAFTWLLFGKDANDRKDFELKTLDKYNTVIPKVEHEVSAIIKINDQTIELKRVLKEKWNKPRGKAEAVFNGNETLFYWNDVPMQAKEYQAKIETILDENIFKLITNPMAFDQLKWQDRRHVLIQMCGDVSDEQLASENPDYKELAAILSTKSLEEYKRETTAKRKKLRDDLKMIPTRIDEVTKGMPDALDFPALEKELDQKTAEIKKTDELIQDKSKTLDAYFEKKKDHARLVNAKETEIDQLSMEVERSLKRTTAVDDSKLNSLKSKLRFKDQDLVDTTRGIDKMQVRQKEIEASRNTKRQAWIDLNARTLEMDDDKFACPTCKRAFEAEDIEQKKKELQENFDTAKKRELEKISEAGHALKAEFENNEKLLEESLQFEENLRKEISDIKTEIDAESASIAKLEAAEPATDLKTALSGNETYAKLQEELETLQQNAPVEQTVDTSALKETIKNLESEREEIQSKLNRKIQIANAKKRIQELEAQEENLSDQMLEIERKEFQAESFVKLKIETLERKINSHFKMVNFKLFSEQVNGGIAEVCEALIDGVPFSSANTASRVNAGLDIINSLCKYYRVNAPIFIDNRESVIHLIDTESQIINLIVSKPDEVLRIEAVNAEKTVA